MDGPIRTRPRSVPHTPGQRPPARHSPARRYALLLLLLPLAAGCAVSREQEIRMGRDARPQFERQFGGLYPDPVVQRYVQEVGMGMARQSGRADLPWEFRVLNSDQVNAFALPGGFIYVTQGLLFNLEDEAQLAGILGHEAGHVEHRHSVQQIQRQQLVQGGALLAGLLGGGLVGDASQAVAGLALMKYSRDQEKEADLSGLQYLSRAGYEPRALVEDMRILQGLARGQGKPPEFLSSHPNPGSRVDYLQDEIEKNYAGPQVRVAAGSRGGGDTGGGDTGGGGRTGRDAFVRNVLSRRR